jgi:Na+-translocating ferredoxin:NAD+ oxidoreductase RNF subunit RnfB
MDILIATAIVAGIGLLCAIMLVLAAKFFAVPQNKKFNDIRECLPGANCGACGYTGCDGYAKALADDDSIKTNLCIPGADAVAKQIAEILGKEAEDVIEQVAVIHCYGDCTHTVNKMDYVGISSCEAAKTMYGGKGKCGFGCMGFGDCLAACPQNAICLQNGIAHINTRVCIGCGICVRTCPQGLISLMSDEENVLVTCNNKEKGAIARSKCSNACIGCKKCEKNCPSGAIKVENNLAVIDYSLCTKCGLCANNCPVGCILVSDFNGIHKAKF